MKKHDSSQTHRAPFNGTKLFAALATLTFQVGANNTATDQTSKIGRASCRERV